MESSLISVNHVSQRFINTSLVIDLWGLVIVVRALHLSPYLIPHDTGQSGGHASHDGNNRQEVSVMVERGGGTSGKQLNVI